MPKAKYKNPNLGTLYIKAWSMHSANCGHISTIIKEIQTKKGIKIDGVIIDY